MPYADLASLPPGFAESDERIDGLDACFSAGLSRLGDAERVRLEQFVSIFGASPLSAPLRSALDSLLCAEFKPEHLACIAIARASLQAAQHDALRAQLAAALAAAENSVPAVPQLRVLDRETVAKASGAQQWLMQLAITGFANLQASHLTAFAPNLEALQEDRASGRAAVLLTGFLHELLEAAPIANPGEVPQRRWADLWTRAMLAVCHPVVPDLAQPAPVAGMFLPVGVDVRCHGHFIALAIHGIFEPAEGGARWSWVGFQRYKVDLLEGREIWTLFQPEIDPFLRALADGLSVRIPQAGLHGDGRLSFSGAVETVDPATDLWKACAAVPCELRPAPDVYTRHPIHLAQPFAADAVEVKEFGDGMSVQIDGATLPILAAAIPAWSELRPALAGAKRIAGLLRFDAGTWQVQPLCVQGRVPPKPLRKKEKPPKNPPVVEALVRTGMHALAALEVSPAQTLSILSERAGKLLRGS